jgi:hypothetical protein
MVLFGCAGRSSGGLEPESSPSMEPSAGAVNPPQTSAEGTTVLDEEADGGASGDHTMPDGAVMPGHHHP